MSKYGCYSVQNRKDGCIYVNQDVDTECEGCSRSEASIREAEILAVEARKAEVREAVRQCSESWARRWGMGAKMEENEMNANSDKASGVWGRDDT